MSLFLFFFTAGLSLYFYFCIQPYLGFTLANYSLAQNFTFHFLSLFMLLILAFFCETHDNGNQRSFKNLFKDDLLIALVALSLLTVFGFFRSFQASSFVEEWGLITWLPAPFLYLASTKWPKQGVVYSSIITLFVYLFWLPQTFNANVFMFFIFGLAALSMPALKRFAIIPLCAVIVFSACLEVVGGVLASGVALLLVLRFSVRFKWICTLVAFVVLFIVVSSISPRSILLRIDFWKQAFSYISAAPVFGNGFGLEYTVLGTDIVVRHAHNMFISTFVELGLIGFVVICFFVRSIFKRWEFFPSHSKALILGYGVWSLIDVPLLWWPSLMFFIIAISQIDDSKLRSL